MVIQDSAFPVTQPAQSLGLTKREYFAACAMRGACEWDAIMNRDMPLKAGNMTLLARSCVGFADAVIAELEKIDSPKNS